MKTIKSVEHLSALFDEKNCRVGCFADTGFLYAMAYDDDRFHDIANKVFDLLADREIPIYVNVISRIEFVDLIFRKQITLGAIRVFNSLDSNTAHRSLFNLLKNIRDRDTADRKNGNSYKIGEVQLKNLRRELERSLGLDGWKEFCKHYAGEMLTNEWSMLEQEFGLNFIEVMEGGVSDQITAPLFWKDMVQIMGNHGLRGPDAMIVNLFSKSEFPLLITGDGDFELCFPKGSQAALDRAIFLLE